MIESLRQLEIKEYAESVIFAFEFKEPITSFAFKGKEELGFFLDCMADFEKSMAIIQLIEDERIKRKQLEQIFNSIVIL